MGWIQGRHIFGRTVVHLYNKCQNVNQWNWGAPGWFLHSEARVSGKVTRDRPAEMRFRVDAVWGCTDSSSWQLLANDRVLVSQSKYEANRDAAEAHISKTPQLGDTHDISVKDGTIIYRHLGENVWDSSVELVSLTFPLVFKIRVTTLAITLE